MKLVLHIGTPKTASTFLQESCAANRDWLAARGVLWPDLLAPTGNHITLLYAVKQGISTFARSYGLKTPQDVAHFRERLSEKIAEQIADAPPGVHTMLMSSENLTGNMRQPGIQGLRALLAPHFDEIRVLVYLRRPDDAILSMYAEFMRKGFSNERFDAFVERALDPAKGPPFLHYRRQLQEWEKVFGRPAITPRLFDRAELAGGDVLADFLTQVLGEVPDLEGFIPSARDNPSLAAPVLEFLRMLQPAIPFARDGEPNPRRARLAPVIGRLPTTPRPQISAAQSARIMGHFAPQNEWLRARYFPDRPAPLFPTRDDLPEEGNLGRVGLQEFATFARALLEGDPAPARKPASKAARA